MCSGVFEVATSQTIDGTSYNFYCIQDGVRGSCEIVTLYALLIGAGTLCALWTLYLPFRYHKLRRAIRNLELERNLDEERLFALEKTKGGRR